MFSMPCDPDRKDQYSSIKVKYSIIVVNSYIVPSQLTKAGYAIEH